MKALAKSFPTNQFFFKYSKYFKSYHRKTKTLKICTFFKKLLTSFVTMLLLVIAKINYLTRNKPCMTTVNTISPNIRKYP